MSKDKQPNTKKHADFQNSYRRSSNFSTLTEDETEKLKIKGDGDLSKRKPSEDNDA